VTARILVVDDSMTVRMDLVDLLGDAGFDGVGCASIAAARAELKNAPFHLILLDVLLPDGDGVDFLVELRNEEATRAVPIVLLSTEAEVRDRVRGLGHGADEYLGKPYDATYLLSRARSLLGRNAPESSRALVLLIDDSSTYREALGAALVGAGYEVRTAASGEEGLRIAAEARPTAILVDGVLPGIDGATVIRRVRLDAAIRRTPCILLTASEEKGAEMRAFDAGADTFVRKAEDVDVVLMRLAATLRSATGQRRDHETASLLAPKKILAVDDSPTYLDTIATVLRGDGYEVILARSGEEALELLALQPVDCLLLDLMMPGIGGTETCRRVKASAAMRDTPIVMLTSLEDRRSMLDGLEAGADDFLSKSSDFEVLRARVVAQIRRKQFEDETRGIREHLLRKEAEIAEARAAQALAEMRAEMVKDLERKNQELDAFSYSVSHDLRAPLRAVEGFSRALYESQKERLDEEGHEKLARVRAAAARMSELIEDLLGLARVSRTNLHVGGVDLSALARAVVDDLHHREPERSVVVEIDEGLQAQCDSRLVRIVLENLFSNAWKFTAKVPEPRIAFRCERGSESDVFSVQDNGAGFDMARTNLLFTPFQRLHSARDFAGTGVGLATVRRIIWRHGGDIHADAAVGRGATFRFTLAAGKPKGTS
jgi:DNA-binding response OmpR family regulator